MVLSNECSYNQGQQNNGLYLKINVISRITDLKGQFIHIKVFYLIFMV